MDKLYSHRSAYQKIEVYGNEFGRMLLLDGVIQFTTADQHRYHEAMAVVPYLFTQFARRVLILGGGDGYAAGLLLRTFPIQELVMVEIDREVIDVSRAFFDFPSDKRLKIRNTDAWEFVKAEAGKRKYDLVIGDYTDPSHPYSARLFTVEHLQAIEGLLSPTGVFAIQMVSPFANPKAASCLVTTLSKSFPGRMVLPYRVYLPYHPPPGQQGFCLATPQTMQLQVPSDLMFLNPASLNSLFTLGNDEVYGEAMPESTETNLLYSRLYRMAFSHTEREWREEIGGGE